MICGLIKLLLMALIVTFILLIGSLWFDEQDWKRKP